MSRRNGARARRQNLVVGAAMAAVLATGLYVAFARPSPLAHPYKLRAVFTSVNGVRAGLTPVRIAGVDVGRVSEMKNVPGSSDTVVTMDLRPNALPVHTDATLKMRPRLFLEGNSFIELHPGTPSAPAAPSGTTIGQRRTSVAVTFPHVLGALTADTRRDLQRTLQSLGVALMEPPSAEDDADRPDFARGLTGAEALNEVYRDGAVMLPQSALVAKAATGERPGDLDRAIDGFARLAEGLNDAGPSLPGLLRHLRQTNAAFASESGAVTASLRTLPSTLASSRRAFVALRTTLPPAMELVRATDDALPAVPAALRAGTPWLDDVGGLLGRDELGGDLDQLVPATRSLTVAHDPTRELFLQLDLLSRCSSTVLTPTANAKIEDGPRTSGTSTFAEFLSGVVGANGVAQTFDGNGGLLRANLGGGAHTLTTGIARQLAAPSFGNALSPPQGTRPAASVPAAQHRPDVVCADNRPPDLNGPAAAIGPADGSTGGGR